MYNINNYFQSMYVGYKFDILQQLLCHHGFLIAHVKNSHVS